MTAARDYGVRYVAYARAHGRTPDEQHEHDVERFPGGRMAGYIVWIGQQWATWRAEHGRARDVYLSKADHASFDAWLMGRVERGVSDVG